MNAKVKEGDMLVEEAEKHLKTGFFKWRSDYDSAAACFKRAAVAYKNGRAFEKSCETYIKLADCHYKNSSRFHAGKAYEEAGQVCRDMKEFARAMAHYDHASELYLEDGTPDTAALCLDKAGKMVQMSHPEWAIASYMKAAEIYENEDQNRHRSAAELVGKVARLQAGLKKYTEALKSVAHEKKLLSDVEGGDHGAGARLTCALVLLHLAIGDQVTAEQSIYDACDNVVGFDESEEYNALQKLLEAYDQGDQEKLSQILNTPLFKYMDTAYAKLARSLKVPGYTGNSSRSVSTAPKQSQISNTDIEKMSQKVDHITDNFTNLQAAADTLSASALQPSTSPSLKQNINQSAEDEDIDFT